MVGRFAKAIAKREQQCTCALLTILTPRRRALDEPHGLLEQVCPRSALSEIAERLEPQLTMPVLGRALGKEHHPRLAWHRDEHARQLFEVLRLGPLGRVFGPQLLLVERQAIDGDGLPVVADNLRTPHRIGRDGHDPWRLAHERLWQPAPTAAHARRSRRNERARLERIDVEQRVQGDRAVCVRCSGLGEVDDDAGFLAAMEAHDATNALLVDATTGGRCEVHADGGARRVPALSEQLGVDQHVDFATLVGGKRLGEFARWRASRDCGGFESNRPHRCRNTNGVVDTGGVDDARALPKHVEVVHRGRHVDGVVVERVGELLLVVVATNEPDALERCARRHAHSTERGDDTRQHGLAEREVCNLGWEDIADVLLQQLVGGGHADIGRRIEPSNCGRGAITKRRMSLVAEDHAIDVAVEAIGILDKPRIGLDRDRRHQRRLGSAEHGVLEAMRVALLLEVALELVDQETAMGEDQDAGDLGGIDEGSGGDGLAGGGRVLEAVAANGARVVDRLFARRVIVVVIIVIVWLVNARECNAGNRTVDDRR